MRLPHPIPYQGSKRNLAPQILQFFPDDIDRLIEPFAGSAAITIATAFHGRAERFILNDVNAPLMNLWQHIIESPHSLIQQYHDIWQEQQGKEESHYYHIREQFNTTHQPEYLLFLLAKCVKAAVRYNTQGQFNQSPDKRRLGKTPQMMREDINNVSQLLKGKTTYYTEDYQTILEWATQNDLVYMDPPYQGTGINGGFNYAGNIDYDNFIAALFDLNQRNIPFLLSYDGRTGDKTHGRELPQSLDLIKIELNAGRSSQATLLSRNEITFESLYISPALREKIDVDTILDRSMLTQTTLFAL